MIDKKHKDLINKLTEKTRAKKANWSKTSGNDEYKIALETATITLDNWEDRGMNYMDFRIFNDRGDLISTLTFPENELIDYNFLRKLHDFAKENYYRVDETIDDIFSELDSEKEIGKKEGDDYADLPF